MRYLTPILTENMDENTRFIDLFSGGANVICQIPFKNKIAVDNNKYVIALWKELQRHGMKRIPNKLTEEEYNDIKKSYLNGEKRYPKYLIMLEHVAVLVVHGSMVMQDTIRTRMRTTYKRHTMVWRLR